MDGNKKVRHIFNNNQGCKHRSQKKKALNILGVTKSNISRQYTQQVL